MLSSLYLFGLNKADSEREREKKPYLEPLSKQM